LRETERRRTPFCFISAGPFSFLFFPSWNNSRCNQHDRSSLVFQLKLCAKARDVYSTFLFHHLATLSRLLSRPPESQWSIHIRRPFIRSLIHFEFPATFELHISSQTIELFQSHNQLTSNVCLMSLDTIHAGCVILTILLYWGSRGPAAKKDQLLTSH
jgi:hypothetical protein